MSVSRLVSARDRLLDAAQSELAPNRVCEAILEAVRTVAPFQAGHLMLVDSDTLLPMGGVVDGMPEETCAPYWDTELIDPDFAKFAALVHSTEPVQTLWDATDGDLCRSPRYQKVYRQLGASDEMRAAFTAGSSCLAVGAFVRLEPQPPFSTAETAAVRQLIPTAVVLLRSAFGRMQEAASDATTVVIVDAAGEVESITAGGWAVLARLLTPGGEQPDGSPKLPTIVRAAATRVRWSRSSTRLATRVRDNSGRGLRMHLVPLEGDPSRMAISIEPARPGDLFPILLESYGLTPRECEVALLLVRGMAVKQIAADSPGTRCTAKRFRSGTG